MTTEARLLRATTIRLNARAWGIAVGLLCGLTLFVATNFLVWRGGEHVGPHLALLSIYFPGYQVSPIGSAIGFIYAYVVGYGLGRLVGSAYNRFAGHPW